MPIKAFSVEFAGFAEMNRKLLRLEADAKAAATKALEVTRDIVTREAEIGMQPQYLPEKGKYQRKDTSKNTLSTLIRDAKVEWKGDEATIEAGFRLRKSLVSIFLMRGTPKMEKDQKLYDAFFGEQVRQEYLAAQKEIYEQAIEKAMNT